jgi:molybdenum cofactor guanylyltransferase
MLGVVLCGGQSSRMGSDKGLLKLHASTWAQTAVDKITELQLPVLISINPDQYNDYAAVFSTEQLVPDNITLELKGPLCGLMSVHLRYPSSDLFILACDMPLMETSLLKELINYYTSTAADAFVYTDNNQPEPLCGIYKASALAHIYQLYQSSELPKHSMKYLLEQVKTFALPLADDQKKYFRNFNAHAELNGL